MSVAGPPRSQYYGRRSARRLTGSRIDTLKSALSKYELTLPPPQLPRPLWIEIGFGSGEHLLAQAKAHPDVCILGVEPYLNGVAVLLRSLEAEKIGNVRIYPEDARLMLAQLPDASVSRAHILFADPWPKSRHNRRRIIGPDTLAQLGRVMEENGRIYLATDHPDLAEWYETTFSVDAAWKLDPAEGLNARIRPAGWPSTRYEAKAIASGRQPWYFEATRRDPLSG